MKKACLICLLFLALIYEGKAQYVPMLNDSAVWRQGIRQCTDGGWLVECGAWNYYDFKLSDDTILNSKQYTKVYLPFNDWWPYAYLREDSGKVYLKYEYESEFPYYDGSNWAPQYFRDTTEFILYDFSLHVGDTFTTRIHNCITSLFPAPDTIEHLHHFVLTQIDIVTLNNGASRKRFHLENTQEPWGDNYAQTYNSLEWIEGIGSTFTFFYNEYNSYYPCGIADAGFSIYELACYSLNDTIVWGATNCQLPTSLAENKNPKISLYPNPVSDELTAAGVADKSTYSIYNILGGLVSSGTIKGGKIDFTALPQSSYLLVIVDDITGQTFRQVIIK